MQEDISNAEVAYQVQDQTAWLTMNRPEVLNALSKGMFRSLEESIRRASKDPSVRFIVLKGSGRAFSAGLDVREVSRLSTKKEAREFVYGIVKPFWELFFKCDKPVIAIVDGPAYGAGAEIALASDIVIASTRSTFAFSGGRVGALCCISAAFGQDTILGRKVTEMNLTGAAASAEEARSFGLVNYVEESVDVEDRLNKIIGEMRHVSPISNSSFKRIRGRLFTTPTLNIAHRELFRAITSPDFQKGAAAFLHKTSPNYYC
ncbi:MAG TPA: enoyl-CoA hydratase/isomerase family protein [Candidatus Dormibacteraeota bacterium]|nr:enoyl-CoA hydratase/isomerase family protein [Candidatus Dormibacteraeota bacterium]